MLTERHLDRYADVLIWALNTARTDRFKKNDIVVVRFSMQAVRLAEILHAKLLDRGIHPVLRMNSTSVIERNFYERSNHKQLVFQIPGEDHLCKNLNGGIFLHAPESITHLSDVDPKRIGKVAVSRKYLRDILDKRDEKGIFGWTLCILPTEELARHAGITIKEYTDQVVKACFLNKRSPVEHWQNIFKNAKAIKKWLYSMKVKHYHVESENVDLIVTPGDRRKWVGLSGHNIPSFEIFLSPDWRGTEGTYYADQPSYRSGNFVENVKLEFKKGSVVKVEAKTGENFVKTQLSIDKGANKVGEFSLTDKRFSKIDRFMANTLFDENYGGEYGNCHVALGSSYTDAYDGDLKRLTKERKKKLGFNDSALHWDLVNTEKKRVVAHLTSGKRVTIYENGKFTD
ncbi:aminopeptidase [Thermodesulfobacteriota bacterium]